MASLEPLREAVPMGHVYSRNPIFVLNVSTKKKCGKMIGKVGGMVVIRPSYVVPMFHWHWNVDTTRR